MRVKLTLYYFLIVKFRPYSLGRVGLASRIDMPDMSSIFELAVLWVRHLPCGIDGLHQIFKRAKIKVVSKRYGVLHFVLCIDIAQKHVVKRIAVTPDIRSLVVTAPY